MINIQVSGQYFSENEIKAIKLFFNKLKKIKHTSQNFLFESGQIITIKEIDGE